MIESGNRRKADRLIVALVEHGYFGRHVISEEAVHPSPSIAAFAQRSVIGGDARHRAGADRNNAWLTPAVFIGRIRAAFGGAIDLDPCTEPGNPTRAKRYYALPDDGLRKRWKGRVFCNPPYSPVEPWIDKAIAEAAAGAHVYLLLPVRTDAAYHHRLLGAAKDVLFIRGRIRFIRADGEASQYPAFGSMVVGLNVSCAPLSDLGRLLAPCFRRKYCPSTGEESGMQSVFEQNCPTIRRRSTSSRDAKSR